AAGALLIQEAGGKVTDLEGNPYRISEERVLASNGRIHDKMVGVLKQVYA
ncbi:MAG: inositol monophosphatase family protein, partial [Bacteroidota bacterium]